MLTHLVDDHGELVPLLLRLVQPQPDKGVKRILPLAMDRYGVTLRLEYSGSHRDVRLPFAKPWPASTRPVRRSTPCWPPHVAPPTATSCLPDPGGLGYRARSGTRHPARPVACCG